MAFHQYNTFQYNTAQYNADARFLVQRLTESVSSADARLDNPTKVLADTVASADALVKSGTKAFSEAVLSLDTVAKSILNKGFSESVRTNDWLQVQRNSGSQWGN